jgi:hypothetical protein
MNSALAAEGCFLLKTGIFPQPVQPLRYAFRKLQGDLILLGQPPFKAIDKLHRQKAS